MKKKGLLAMGLAGVLTVGMCMPVLAAAGDSIVPTSGTNGTPNPATAETTVEITEPIKYTLKIPAAFTMDTADNTVKAELTATDVNLEPGKTVRISTSDSNVELINASDSKNATKWNMVLKADNTEFKTAEFISSKDEQTKELSLEEGTNIGNRLAGVYKGKVTFNISYVESSN